MTRSFFAMVWRLLLAISLVVGPWPPAAWAAVAPATAPAGAEDTDCHGKVPAATPPADAPCEDDCCPDPACDPAHCLLLHASLTSAALPVASVPLATAPGLRNDRLSTGPPQRSLLRPPIA